MFWAEPLLTPDFVGEELELRKKFVEEYIFCQNPVTAAQRIGFSGKLAAMYAEQFMSEPHVQKLIKEEELRFAKRAEEGDDILKSRIISALFAEATSAYQSSARVTALSKLANMMSLDGTLNRVGDIGDTGQIVINVKANKKKEDANSSKEQNQTDS